jgi:hypothetical protein
VPGGDLIVERLAGQTLVFDPASGEAHCLTGSGAQPFGAAPDDISRRQVLRHLALAGAAAAGGGALLRSIVSPTPAQAQSSTCPGCSGINCTAGNCTAGATCCVGTPSACCPPSIPQCCLGTNGTAFCCLANQTCLTGTQTCF